MFFLKKRKKADQDEPIDELPSLAMDIIGQRVGQENQTPPPPAQKKEMPKTHIGKPVMQRQVQPAQANSQVLPEQNDEEGYFGELLNQLEKESQDINEDMALNSQRLLEGDLLNNMKHDWERRKQDVLFTHEEESMRSKIIDKINTLKDIEQQWQEHHLEVIKNEERLRTEEAELKRMIENFRELCGRHIDPHYLRRPEHKHQQETVSRLAEPSRVFITHDGQKILSTEELSRFIKTLNAVELRKYVSGKGNDFSNWVRFAFNDNALADKLLDARNKQELLGAFQTYS